MAAPQQRITVDQVFDAFDIATRITADPAEHLTDTVTVARALLRVRDLMTTRASVAEGSQLGPGARLRLSVKLIRDLDDMPDHQSVTVRIVRIERGPDGVAELVLTTDHGRVS